MADSLAARRVLIAGCGYVGSALGTRLTQRGQEVFGLTRTDHRKTELAAAGIHALVADVTQAKQLSSLPSNYDSVVMAFSSKGGTAVDYQQLYLEGARHLLQWLVPSPPRQVVYISSTSVYGQNDGSTVDETSATEPEAETSRVLLATEQFIISACRQAMIKPLIFRAAGIYGPERGYWLRQVLEGRARLDGNGERWVNMIHRDDLAGIIATALERDVSAQVINAVDDEPVRQKELFEWLDKTIGRSASAAASQADQTAAPPLRKRGATNKRISNQKLKQELGYEFLYPTFREGFSAELSASTTKAK